jgi:hypothetical protein
MHLLFPISITDMESLKMNLEYNLVQHVILGLSNVFLNNSYLI